MKNKTTVGFFHYRVVFLLVGLLLAVLFFPLEVQAQPGNQVGYVLDMRGRWLLDGGQEIQLGQSLPAGGVVSPTGREPAPYLTVVYYDGKQETFSGPGRRTLQAGSPVAPGFSQRIVAAVGRIFSRNPETYSTALSRLPGEAEQQPVQLPNAVLPVQAESTDISPLLTNLEAGAYRVGIRSIHLEPDVDVALAGQLFEVTWDGKKAALPQTLPAGLYEIDATPRPPAKTKGAPSWVLFVRADQLGVKRKSFQEAQALADKWQGGSILEARERFLRAFLVELAGKPVEP